jgi:hypothetical protein
MKIHKAYSDRNTVYFSDEETDFSVFAIPYRRYQRLRLNKNELKEIDNTTVIRLLAENHNEHIKDMFLRYKGLEGIMDSYITNVGDIK